MKEMETMISSREGGGGKVFYLLWQNYEVTELYLPQLKGSTVSSLSS